MVDKKIQKSSQTRLWLIEDRAGPAHVPSYSELARSLGVDWSLGDLTNIDMPNPDRYDDFIIIDQTRGRKGLPTMSLEGHLQRTMSKFLRFARKNCPFDLQLHAGVCEDPRDFNGGWEKIYVLEGASPTNYSTGELGAFNGDQNTPVLETLPVSGLDYYELKRMLGSELAAAAIVQEVIAVKICDAITCGLCGLPSDGCQRLFALTATAAGSPGLAAELIYSNDGGATIGQSSITSLAANEDPSGLACSGTNLAVVSQESTSLHYADISDLLAGSGVWTEVTTGFVATKGPNAIYSRGSVFNWMVGEDGYVYFSDDITSGVEVQSAGAATTEDLLAIHGADEFNLVAVGENNAVIKTNDGGLSWASVTGPAVGVNLVTVYVKSDREWFVGTAGGRLYYTRDAGVSWTEKAFPGSGSGVVRKLSFSSPSVGYMSHDTTTPRGRILRTINGGFSWYVLPEQAGQALPLNDRLTDIDACTDDRNFVLAGGLADNAIDGILMKVN